MRGGHSRSGRAPDPNALRRDRKTDHAGWTLLPAAGRVAEPPAWPLVEPSPRELVLWGEVWRRPQAVEWERCWMAIEVALYVRYLAAAEQPGAKVTLSVLVRQMADSLGLSPAGLRSNRWLIEEPPPAATVSQFPAAGPSSRERLPRKSTRERVAEMQGAAGDPS